MNYQQKVEYPCDVGVSVCVDMFSQETFQGLWLLFLGARVWHAPPAPMPKHASGLSKTNFALYCQSRTDSNSCKLEVALLIEILLIMEHFLAMIFRVSKL